MASRTSDSRTSDSREVVDGVAGQAQLGEGGQADTVVGQGAGLLDDGGGVGGRIDRHHRQGDGGDAGEALVVGGEELNVGRRAVAESVAEVLAESVAEVLAVSFHGCRSRLDPPIDGAFLRDHRSSG